MSTAVRPAPPRGFIARCGKLGFRTRQAAEAAMRSVPPGTNGIVPQRTYWHGGKCRCYHFTSRLRRKP